MTQILFNPGDVVFAEGNPSDFVYQITGGEAEVVKETGGRPVPIRLIKSGEFAGGMGVIGERPRAATVRAKTPLVVKIFSKEEFLEHVSRDAALSLQFLLRLSERLKSVGQADTHLTETKQTGPKRNARQLTLLPGSRQVSAQIPADGVIIETLPFAIGRETGGIESNPGAPINLCFGDVKPYRLSRAHFSIELTGGRYVVRDLGSTLGTRVNGEAIGRAFTTDVAPLAEGGNTIVAGRVNSPFKFQIVVGETTLNI